MKRLINWLIALSIIISSVWLYADLDKIQFAVSVWIVACCIYISLEGEFNAKE